MQEVFRNPTPVSSDVATQQLRAKVKELREKHSNLKVIKETIEMELGSNGKFQHNWTLTVTHD